jgi:hypothetical protein
LHAAGPLFDAQYESLQRGFENLEREFAVA